MSDNFSEIANLATSIEQYQDLAFNLTANGNFSHYDNELFQLKQIFVLNVQYLNSEAVLTMFAKAGICTVMLQMDFLLSAIIQIPV